MNISSDHARMLWDMHAKYKQIEQTIEILFVVKVHVYLLNMIESKLRQSDYACWRSSQMIVLLIL